MSLYEELQATADANPGFAGANARTHLAALDKVRKAQVTERQLEVGRIQAKLGALSPARILSAMGHPGYGDAFARDALVKWVHNPELSLHDICIGGL